MPILCDNKHSMGAAVSGMQKYVLKLPFYTQSCGLGLDLVGPGLGLESPGLGLVGPGLVNITDYNVILPWTLKLKKNQKNSI